MSIEPGGTFEAERGIGERLRNAREAMGLGIAEVSQKLRMPARVVESLEAEDWSRLGAPVFVRGQLRSYARLLGLPLESSQTATPVARPIQPSTLTPRTYTPHAQRVAEQFARRLVYVVITAAIAVPVWLATRSHLSLPATQTAALDVEVAQRPSQAPNTQAAGVGNDAQTAAPRPLAASFTPMHASASAQASPSLGLRFRGDSWIQVIGNDGMLLEKGLLHAGEQRDYPSGQVKRVVLGNATEVDVLHNGQAADIKPFLRANVARFAVSSDGTLAPSAD